MKEYIKANKEIYNIVADEYGRRLPHYAKSQKSKAVADPFITAVKKNFKKAHVLEIGPGSGLDLIYLEKANFKTTAIDISEKMIEVAKKASLKTKYLVGDFSNYNFKNQKFQGIFTKALIHLYPKKDAIVVMKKIKKLLVPKGIAYINTTKHKKPSEGYYFKKGFSTRLRRYRKKWTEDELKKVLIDLGFHILCIDYHFERDRGKNWMYFVVQK